MQEGKRQKQVGALLLHEMSDIFQRLGLSMVDGGMVSLTAVKVTPDLLEARVYLSLFQARDVTGTMKKIEERGWEIKRELASRVKHQLRRIPTLQYVYDDTLEHADKMEALFRKMKKEEGAARGDAGQGKQEKGGGDLKSEPPGEEDPQ
jgi:ribosome-binding factor A